jgi:hypothetical protein
MNYTRPTATVLLLGLGCLILWEFPALLRWTRNRRIVRFVFSEISTDQITVKGELTVMELKEGKKAVLIAVPKTRAGHAAAIQAGSARWTSSDDSVVSVEQDPTNELGAIIRGLDGSKNESVVIELRADGDPGEGDSEIVGTMAVVCTQGDATTFDLEVASIDDDVPAEQPAPTPATTAGEGSATAEGSAPAGNAGSDVADPGTLGGAAAGEVKAGDPGTATGEPLPSANPNDGPDAMPDPDIAKGGEPIAGADTAGADNPVAGTEADSAKPAGDDVQSPSNLPGTGGNAF